MSHTALKMLAITACFSIAGAAQAATVYKATLSGSNENPPNATTGTGVAFVTIDEALGTMKLDVTFQNMTNPTTIAHIHCCAVAPNNAGVATTVPTFAGFPTGVTSGSYLQTFDMNSADSYNPAFVTAHGGVPGAFAFFLAGMNSGSAYLNLHTAAFPAGEIRGNFAAIPEPGTWALMITGFGLTGVAIRRRRAALARSAAAEA
jgi:hypothetical protein